jgi:DNA-binding CsgD family transcriptional regulator
MVAPGLVALGGAALAQDDRERARPLLRDALTLAEARHDRASQALALAALGDLARADGDDDRGRRLHHESLSLRAEIGDRAGIADSLEALAGLSVADGLLFPAGRLFGAAEALREKGGYQRAFWRRARYEADVASLTRGAAAEKIEAARQAGRKLRIEQAVRLASKGRGRRDRPATGWDALTPTEREVVELVTEGLTNAEVGARLFVSRETVKAHLSRVFAKLGVRSRRELRTLGRYDG